MKRLVYIVAALATSAACSPSRVDYASSCNGATDSTCEAYAFAEATSATLMPAGLRPGDYHAMAQLHVDLHTCATMSPRHSVILRGRATSASPLGDGGASDHVFNLATVSDDGTHGDAHADDGIIDAVIANPFDINVPGGATIELSVTPHAGASCDGTTFTLPYTTGATCFFVPPATCNDTP